MNRPGTFPCLDGKNRAGLRKAFGSVQNGMFYARYGNEIVERVRDETVWWNAPPPPGGDELEIWLGRTAFDALYYDALYYKE